jgi:4-amino-4-deoxy-L-arabinose transferase-like glycosyltransferase
MKETGTEQFQFVFSKQLTTIAILLLLLLFYLPFINKAFHIDDPAFINLSQMFDWNPLIAFPVDYEYMGRVLPHFLPYEATHPLLVPYIIKVVTALFGQNEIPLHLVFAIFPLIAIWSLIKLNTELFPEFRLSPAYVAVFFYTMPAFMVNAQNVMTDLPSLAFLLLALAGFVSGVEHGSWRMTWLGSVALTLAVFTSYQNLVFLPLILFYSMWKRKLDVNSSLALAMPLVVLLGWLFAIYAAYDLFPLLKERSSGTSASVSDEIKRGLVAENLIGKIIFIFGYVGSAMIWIVPAHYALKKALARFFRSFIPLLAGSYLATTAFSGYSGATKLMLSTFVALGLQTIVTVGFLVRDRIRSGRNAPEAVFLFIWFLSVIGYNIAVLPFAAARYLLPAFPPLLLIILNDQAWVFFSQKSRGLILGALCGSALFAVGTAYSDYQYAGAYREFAGEVVKVRAEVGMAPTFWYVGEWGMRHYMDKAGARMLHETSNEPKAGDFIVIPEMPRFWEPSKLLQQRLVFFANRKFTSALPIRLFNKRSHAGFYSHLWGMLPFAFSTEPDEVFTVYRVAR